MSKFFIIATLVCYYSKISYVECEPHEPTHPPNKRGCIMCAANKMIPDVIKMVRQTRDFWNSTLGYAVAHCSEIGAEKQQEVWYVEPTVQFIDICREKKPFGIDSNRARRRLRGFFCKVAAMIIAPFQETMLLDLDVVWLQKPDVLFDTYIYRETGALFFRSRVFHYQTKRHQKKSNIILEELLPFLEGHGMSINESTVNKRAVENGINFFWLHLASRINNSKLGTTTSAGAAAATMYDNASAILTSIAGISASAQYPFLSEFQDSSVVVVNKATHPTFISTLLRLLPYFNMGYGDKETFWVAATISGESFSFEPYLAGQYGDCYGIQLHFHPDDARTHAHAHRRFDSSAAPNNNNNNSPETASPLYLNAEYFVEKELTCVGEFVRTRMTHPRLATTTPDLRDCQAYDKPYEIAEAANYSCTCERIGCVDVPMEVNRYLMFVQWLTLSSPLTLPHSHCRNHISQREMHIRQHLINNSTTTNPAAASSSRGGTVKSNSDLDTKEATINREWPCIPIAVRFHRELNILFTHNISTSKPIITSRRINSSGNGTSNNSGASGSSSSGSSGGISDLSDVSESLCSIIGCPHLPIELNASLSWIPNKARYCEPVLFSPVESTPSSSADKSSDSNTSTNSTNEASRSSSGALHDSSGDTTHGRLFLEAVREARSPQSKWNAPNYPDGTVLLQTASKRYHLMKGNTSHSIPNLATFLKLGLEFSSAIAVPDFRFGNIPVGDAIVPM